MPEFLTLTPPREALSLFMQNITYRTSPEDVETSEALGRITFSPTTASMPLPSFPRSTVDGYAVHSGDTYGASESLPAYLKLVGEVPMGGMPQFSLLSNQCAIIHTGGMIPEGADSVVMIENTQQVQEDEVEIFRAVAVGENVIAVGEDVKEGQTIIPGGTRLRPAEIGGLMALGLTQISVARKPKVGIISSGDEVVPPVEKLRPGQVRDVNTFILSAMVEEAGGIPVKYGIVPDSKDAMLSTASKAKSECDLVVITAGSSASSRDLTAIVINELGSPGVLVHGVNVRPGKPTILAVCGGKAIIGLPGNPVSALVISWLFVVPVIEKLLGVERKRHLPSKLARLTINLSSQTGREDWIAVRLIGDSDGYKAEPIFGKSNLIFTLARADGLVRIGASATGISAGSIVEVYLL
jgi:molybdopterin molybdotransferase